MLPAKLVRTAPNAFASVEPQPYGEFYFAVGDIEPVGIDFSGMLANRWLNAMLVANGAAIRPVAANGYQYVAQAGQTGATEPSWPAVAGSQVLDGSVLWTAAPVDTTSLSATLQSASWAAATGISVSSGSTQDQTAIITVNATSAASGTDYNVICTATLSDGEKVVGTIRVKVR